MRKTLGGDRIGAGKKMKVDMKTYNRTTMNMGYLWRSTMAAGTIVPFIHEIALPGDTWDINLGAEVNTHPTIGPLFGSFIADFHVFQIPMRLYNADLHNNKVGIGLRMQDVKLPLITLKATPVTSPASLKDIDNAQINPSCLLSYFGIRGVGRNETGEAAYRDFQALFILGYWDTVKQYYSNKQEEIGAVIHTEQPGVSPGIVDFSVNPIPPDAGGWVTIPEIGSGEASVQTTTRTVALVDNAPAAAQNPATIIVVLDGGERVPFTVAFRNFSNPVSTQLQAYWNWPLMGQREIINYDYLTPTDSVSVKPGITTFPLSNIDDMRNEIFQHAGNPAAFNINTPALAPYSYLGGQTAGGYQFMMSNQEGLALKTYQSDLLNNWVSTEWIDGPGGINEITAIDTSGGSFNIDTLIISRKVYNVLMRVAVSGGTYDDWIDASYTQNRSLRAETPMYMGGLRKEVVFQEVVSNAESTGDEGTQPLGTLAGKGTFSKKHKGGSITIKVDEPSIIIGLCSLTPRIDNSQGNKWHVHLKTMNDLHKPELDEIGFQELITEQMAWWDTAADTVVGGVANWTQKSAGKQPAWINYMTNINEVRGNFAIAPGKGPGGEMFMTLNRNYEYDPGVGIKDLTTYIDPSKYNQIFAQKSLDAQNFWMQIAVDMQARRLMSGKLMPNL